MKPVKQNVKPPSTCAPPRLPDPKFAALKKQPEAAPKKRKPAEVKPPAIPAAALVLIFAFCFLLSAFAQSTNVPIRPLSSSTSGVYTNRLLWNLAASTSTNRIYFTNDSRAFGDTNSGQVNIRSNTSNSKWEWRIGTTVIATNTVNRFYGTWKTNSAAAGTHGYSRYEPNTVVSVQLDHLGVVIAPPYFFATNNPSVSAATVAAIIATNTAFRLTNTVANQEYFYTNVANLALSNRFTFTGGGMSGQFGYAPGASYGSNEYIIDLLFAIQGNPDFMSAATLTNHIALFATNQTAHSQTPGGISQNGSLQLGGYSYHAGFSLVELAYIHYKKSGTVYAYTNFQSRLSNALAYVIKSNNIPSSFGTNGNLWDGWGIAEFGYNAYSAAAYKHACDLMATMAAAANQFTFASNWAWQASITRASMTNLWNETRGLFRTCSQGDLATTHSLAANALIVLYDAADDRLTTRVEEEFVKYSGHNAGFFQHGALRTTPIGECLGSAIDSDCDGTDATGTYQTGGYWPLTWGIEVVKRRRPDIAEDLMRQMHSFMSATNTFYEWWNTSADLGITAVNKGSSNYMQSAGVPATYGLTPVMFKGSSLVPASIIGITGYTNSQGWLLITK